LKNIRPILKSNYINQEIAKQMMIECVLPLFSKGAVKFSPLLSLYLDYRTTIKQLVLDTNAGKQLP
jgi:hypothetical protein